MQFVGDAALIALWERIRSQGPLTRALLCLEAALPDLAEAARMEMSLAARDQALLDFRHAAFGPTLPVVTSCPQCGEELEFELDLAVSSDKPPREFSLADGRRFRLPNSADLSAVIGLDDERAAHMLAYRCSLDGGFELAEATIAEADARMAAIHGDATLAVRLNCDACGYDWRDRLDIAAYLWIELEQHARDLLDQIHWLARHYGWSEDSILAMGPWRRAAYLERCGA